MNFFFLGGGGGNSEYKRTVINPAQFLASFGQAAKLDFFATGCIAIGHFGGGSSNTRWISLLPKYRSAHSVDVLLTSGY